MRNLLYRFEKVFSDELPAGIFPERSIDHVIEAEEVPKPRLRSLNQLFPSELVAFKAYVVELLRKGKIRR